MSTGTLSDDQFVEAFEAGEISSRDFHHLDHIRLAWIYVTRFGLEPASKKIIRGIRNFAAIHGATQLYHETITRFWISAVFDATKGTYAATFAEFIEGNVQLRDKNFIYNFYSKEQIMSEKAKRDWIQPQQGSPGSGVQSPDREDSAGTQDPGPRTF